MLFSRNGITPRVDRSARVARTASVVGDVIVGAGCYVDYGVIIASSGPPVVLGEGARVLANAVIRSVGGHGRPAFPVRIGAELRTVRTRAGQHRHLVYQLDVLGGPYCR
jgi:carbonic anhydrase/acetyltransferase-like protein (isoleucine patch superfamily)